ncbi:MAG TPA: ABC transporter substrate-binding protein [Alphaproteobacteria bacterium]|nr:ABC transporter substrate-binding protein [Alphaproteobacteria bacterium]
MRSKLLTMFISLVAIAAFQTPAQARDLVVGIGGDIETFDVCCANFIQSHHALYAVYEPPVIYPTIEVAGGALVGDPAGVVGTIFESWEASDDGLAYTVKIRKGLTLQNGTPINAELIRYTIDRNLNTPGGGAWLLKNIAFVTKPPEVIDDYTIRLVGDAASPMIMSQFYMTSSAMLDPAIVQEHATDDDPWATAWMQRNVAGGSGPYKIVSHIPDQEIVFEAWDGYHAGKAPIDRMIWKIIPSPAQRALLLRNGDIDIAEGLGEEEMKSLVGADGVQILKAPSGNQVYYGMNNSIAPFDNVLVRRAVSYAINYDDILQNVYNGDAGRLWGPLSETSGMSLGESAGYKQDVNKAKELLASSGYGGETITISIDSSKADRELIAVRVQAALRAIGMDAEIERVTPAVYSERKVAKQLQSTVDSMLAWIDDPNYSLSLVLQCGVYGNYMDYCNEEVDQIIKDGWGESNAGKRRAMFNRAQELIIADAPWAFLAQPDFKLAMSSDLGGYVHYANEIPRYHNYYWK